MRNLPLNWPERKPEDENNGRCTYGLYERQQGNIGRRSRNPLASLTFEPVEKLRESTGILKVHGSVIGTLGNFSASIGKAKSKKTFNVSAIVAAALKNGTVLRYVAELPEDKRKILYVDTEQSPYHCLKVMKRILRMAGLPDDKDNEHLEFLALRKYTPEQRIRIVEQAIYNTPDIALVIIDGIRDMVYDINSPENRHASYPN